MWKKIVQNEKGTVIPFVAIMLSVLIAFLALSMDTARLYITQQRVEMATDIACDAITARAPVQIQTMDDVEAVEDVITATIKSNVGNADKASIYIYPGWSNGMLSSYTVVVTYPVSYIFKGLFSSELSTIKVTDSIKIA